MTELGSLLLGGMVAGGLYAILAAGVVLTYQTSGIFNFAHGAVAFATAYLFVQLNVAVGIPVVVAAVISILVFAPGLGFLLDRLIYSRLSHAPLAAKIVAPIGLLIAVPSACLFVAGRLKAWFDLDVAGLEELYVIPALGPTPRQTWAAGGVLVDSNQVAILGSAALAAAGLWLLLRRTRLGLRMRAVVNRRNLAALRGIDTDRTSAASWMLGSALAGLAGVLLAPLFTLNPPAFTAAVLLSTPAVVFARFRSIPLALAGGLLTGIVQNLIVGYAEFAENIAGFATAVPFVLLFVLLFVFTAGQARGAGHHAHEEGLQPHTEPASAVRKAVVWSVTSAVLGSYVLFLASDFWQSLVIRGLALALVMLSFTVVTGLGGMVSLAQATFVTAAGITAAWVVSHGWPFGAALVAGTLVAAALGVVVSLPARQLGGLPLALSTLALAYLGHNLLFQLEDVSHNADGGWVIGPPALGPVDLADPETMIVTLAVVLGVAVLLVTNLMRSSSGRAMAVLRATEPGAVTIGVAEARTKMAVFALSAGIAGFGGVLLAASAGRVTYADYPVETGLFWLVTVVVIGVRRPAGAVIAGLLAATSPELFLQISDAPYLPEVFMGLAAVNLAMNADGMLALGDQRRFERRRRRELKALRRDAADSQAVTAAEPVAGAAGAAPAAPATSGRPGGGAAEPGLILEVRDVQAGYGDIQVLRGVDLAVRPGEVVALVGANGAGKSMLCLVITGVVPATGGAVRLGGRDVTTLAPHRRVHHGLFLIPEGRGIFPALTVDENLSVWLPSEPHRDEAYSRFPALAGRRRQRAGSLSGGEQQMLALAPALVSPPGLLVVDEPSLGLAPLIVADVYQALRELRDRGTAILLVEEKAHDVLALADTIAFMSVGRIVWKRPAAQVDSDLLARSYLGMADADTKLSPRL